MTYWVTWFPGSLLAAIGVMVLVYKGLRAFIRFNDALPALLKAAGELEHNGGSSVKDDIGHIKTEQRRVADELVRSNAATDARLSRVERKLDMKH